MYCMFLQLSDGKVRFVEMEFQKARIITGGSERDTVMAHGCTNLS